MIDKIIGGVIVLGLSAGGVTGMNFWNHHNISYEEDGKKVIKKADGIFGYTTVKIDKKTGAIDVTRAHLPDYRSYKDVDGDLKVDTINTDVPNEFSRGHHFTILYRNKNLEKYPKIFEKADKDFREQMVRFKPYLNR